jgi:hypothetical protein
LDEVRILADEIMAVQKPKRETKRLNGSKGGRRPNLKKPTGYQGQCPPFLRHFLPPQIDEIPA